VRAEPINFSLSGGPGGAYLASAIIDSSSRSRIVVSHQLADGRWTPPKTIARVRGQAFLPTIAVSGDSGVALTFDRMSSTNRRNTLPVTASVALSSDGGARWHTSQLGRPFDLAHVTVHGAVFVGDYQALVATPAGFEAVYAGTGAGVPRGQTHIYAQTISLRR
jgi:hypothetical protein